MVHTDSGVPNWGRFPKKLVATCSPVELGTPVLVVRDGKILQQTIDHFEWALDEMGGLFFPMMRMKTKEDLVRNLTLIAVSGTVQSAVEVLPLDEVEQGTRARFRQQFKDGGFSKAWGQSPAYDLKVKALGKTGFFVGDLTFKVGMGRKLYVADASHMLEFGQVELLCAVTIDGRIFIHLAGKGDYSDCNEQFVLELSAKGMKYVRSRTISCPD